MLKAKEFAASKGDHIVEEVVGNHIFKYDKVNDALLIINRKNRKIKTYYKNDGRADDIFQTALVKHKNTLEKLKKRN